MPEIDVLPSLLAADFAKLGDEVQRCTDAGARILHCDIMDGHFVPNISFGPFVVETVRKQTDAWLDVHLMLSDPLRYVQAFRDAGADAITVHVEAVGQRGMAEAIERIRDTGAEVGLALNPDTDPRLWLPWFAEVDLVMHMTVYPGFGGQSFIQEVRDFVRTTRRAYPDLDIQVDGGIARDTIADIVADGANRLVCGSAFFKDVDPAGYISWARGLALGDGSVSEM